MQQSCKGQWEVYITLGSDSCSQWTVILLGCHDVWRFCSQLCPPRKATLKPFLAKLVCFPRQEERKICQLLETRALRGSGFDSSHVTLRESTWLHAVLGILGVKGTPSLQRRNSKYFIARFRNPAFGKHLDFFDPSHRAPGTPPPHSSSRWFPLNLHRPKHTKQPRGRSWTNSYSLCSSY